MRYEVDLSEASKFARMTGIPYAGRMAGPWAPRTAS